MEKFISLVIPNYNGSATIGKCLEAAFASRYGNFEVVVADDCSTDDSVEIAKRYPCRLVSLETHSGVSAARNLGARSSRGELLFFTDADCLIRDDALSLANAAMAKADPDSVLGGTYTPLPHDTDFFSVFQSLFVHYSETKKEAPDYVAGHAMVIGADLFKKSGGFDEKFLPQSEDVDFSHRLRRKGCRLVMEPRIQVEHIFGFTLSRSLRNAYRKSKYWTMYSLANHDVLADSGTASAELKVAVSCLFLNMLLAALFLVLHNPLFPGLLGVIYAFDLCFLGKTISFFYREKGAAYSVFAALYYTWLFAFGVGAGAIMGVLGWISARRTAA
jgi:glycosyltransferase involved in cell wall biosynthesis